MTHKCQVCGDEFEGRANAKTCSKSCRDRKSRAPKMDPKIADEPNFALIDAVRDELDKHGALDSRPGRQALQLARMLSGDLSLMTGVASISKELDRIVRVAIEECGAKEANPLDELRRRREAKRAS